jgi:thymidylate kinase
MKLIICEGPDRCGKDTLINRIIEKYPNIVKRHWGFPKGDTDEEKTRYQKESFYLEFYLYDILSKLIDNSIMIWNRSHLGEIVYGTIYRNSDPDSWVWGLERFWSFQKNPEIYLILLYADPEFLAKKDDGYSYSGKLEDKTKEINAFLSAFDKSIIKKKLKIKINEGDYYKDKDLIYQQVNEFIND